MAVFSHPSRAQFARLTAPGAQPVNGQPGSFALNITDRKLWTFDEIGAPVPMSYELAPHDPARAYAEDQLVLVDDTLWRAATNLTPRAFDPSDWRLIAADTRLAPRTPSASGLLTGGLVSKSGAQVTVAAGTGYITDASDPSNITYEDVTWEGQTLTLTAGGDTLRAIAITGAGTVVSRSVSDMADVRRTHVVLGYAEFDNAGDLARVNALARVVSQTAEDMSDFIDATGGAFIIDGAALSNGIGATLTLSSGRLFVPQGNWRTDPDTPNYVAISGQSPLVFDVRRLNGEPVASAQTEIPSDIYEGGFLPPGFSTVHFVFGTPSYRWLQLGSGLHASYAAAVAAVSAEWQALPRPMRQRTDAVVLGAVIASRQVVTDWDGRVFAVRPGAQIGAIFEVSQSASGFLRLDGQDTMQGPLDMGGKGVLNSVIDEGVF